MKLCMGCMNQIEDQYTTCPHCGFNETTLRQESYYLDPGTIVGGKYIVGRVMSYGGHTISYLGMDAEVNRKVIVKEYLPSDFSTRSEGEKEITIYSGDAQEQFEQGLTNFLNEANRIQHLQDVEGIAKVYDCVAENDTGYVISEYVEGQTLKEILDAGKKFTVDEAKMMIDQILRGLSKVHPLDVVHCDISPETIILTDSGEIKLLDFGATRYVTTANSKSLAIILKQGYAPEEQYRSRGVRGPWTDVYAVAAVMYRMITGVVPQESVERALVDDLKDPSKMGVSIPENIENALMNALNVYQNDRTPSADVFLQELNSSTVKRIKVKNKNNETGKFPIWAKCLVACFLCVFVIGGVFLVKMSGGNPDDEESNVIKVGDYAEMDIVEVREKIEEKNEKHGINLSVIEETYIYNSNEKLHGKVASQSISPEEDLSDPETVKNIDGLKWENGKPSGVLKVTVYRSTELFYNEISGMNVYAISKTINKELTDTSFYKAKKQENTIYYDLAEIELIDGTIIKADELADKNNGKKTIVIANIKNIFYYASEFFYWSSFPDFVGKNVDELPSYPTYKMKNETKRVKSNNKKPLTSYIDKSYYTFSDKYEEGDICVQMFKAGDSFDATKDLEELKEGYLLGAICKKINYAGFTGAELEKEIKGLVKNIEIKYEGAEPSDKVSSVTVKENGNRVDCFKDNVTITITTKKEEPKATSTPEPKATSTPVPESGGDNTKIH